MKDVKAVAFDIDGTLYANWRLNVKIVSYFIKNLPFFLEYSKVRKILHRTAPLADFYEYQARLLAERMRISSEEAKNKIENIIYKGLGRFFPKIKPYPYLEELFSGLKASGFKIGILSDFPPSQKGDMWGLAKYCDVILGSESIGALKPSVYAFGLLAKELGVEAQSVLYVGNNISADIIGAHKAGMKTAYILPFWRKFFNLPLNIADISFKNYRQLKKIVLN